ncbi:hypothetical protein BATDEDRAFT_91726 [Batrachochytrium dendrobatidis JAM81]|uniref:CCHC-type domain-containing protein n=2 Tax=Batrachochytrium dendrobatidis TaxID=109871 RepID=F4PBV5_BATDJ|nr:uncharacterized protein BATDEDRAFT_91726 [Batrachochytrium dendrobatidis JAM81]EGF77518.1 hypothetical protein BATDEDRAFT_91726 [Batrachochytrium dendrobatidis JAM81]OAJ37666.1 hypothetical protein BDEG_21665 [Batrachochytrium dendrobatidis JEL423]|eukprot:XP_006682105.1 hypothetical protein BATDEDRAFT_91726 [Batrachochytrium dendrobatidis JAM81]
MKVLVVGSLGEKLEQALDKIATINKKHGPFELLLCAGDLFGSDPAQQLVVLESILVGKIKIPIPTYFMAGKHVLAAKLMDLIEKTEGQLTENLIYLGSRGTTTTADQLSISVCSGVNAGQYSKKQSGQILDILLSSGWPSQIQMQSPLATVKLSGKLLSVGSALASDLAIELAPRYMFSTDEGVFFEREPFQFGGAAHYTRFIGLGAFGAANKERWFYAMNIVPAATLDTNTLKTKPEVVTSCPLTLSRSETNQSTSLKRPSETETATSFFWDQGNPTDGRKKRQRAPPDTYVCHRCKQPGHWKDDCTMEQAQHQRSSGTLPDGYVCKICNVPGHHIRECPEANHNRLDQSGHRNPNGLLTHRDDSLCWFCTSNEKLEVHLILTILDKTYISIAKGGLVPGHVLIVPITHFTSTQSIQHLSDTDTSTDESIDAKETINEMNQVQRRIREIETTAQNDVVVFEVYTGKNIENPAHQRLHHLHLQVVPVPKGKTHEIEAAFKKEAEKQQLECLNEVPKDDSVPYLKVELENGKTLVFSPSTERIAEIAAARKTPGSRAPRLFDMQLGRRVMADVLNMPDRADWKQCVVNIKEEEELVETLKPIYENFQDELNK